MNEELKKNIDTEMKMLKEIYSHLRRMEQVNVEEKKLLSGAVKSLTNGLRIINDSIPKMLSDISLAKKLPTQKNEEKFLGLEKISFEGSGLRKMEVVLDSGQKEEFLKELSINESFLRKLRRKNIMKKESYSEFRASSGYLKWSNKLFWKTASEQIEAGKFRTLEMNLRKANMNILYKSYIAMTFLSVLLSFIVSFLLGVFLFFIDVSFTQPFVSFYDGATLMRFLGVVWIPIVVPAIVFLGFYLYPAAERKSLGSKINQELPFAVIHMSAISGSGIEPSEIFKIIGLNREYPFLRKEIRKILNQINLYGYDLSTALRNAARSSPSEKLSELFLGMVTTITSGAKISDFFEKRAETLLLSYRLEREKYTKLVETFLDVYISVVIAAPMIFLLLLIMMVVSGIYVGFSSTQLSVLSVVAISLLNIGFLFFLQIKQPNY